MVVTVCPNVRPVLESPNPSLAPPSAKASAPICAKQGTSWVNASLGDPVAALPSARPSASSTDFFMISLMGAETGAVMLGGYICWSGGKSCVAGASCLGDLSICLASFEAAFDCCRRSRTVGPALLVGGGGGSQAGG